MSEIKISSDFKGKIEEFQLLMQTLNQEAEKINKLAKSIDNTDVDSLAKKFQSILNEVVTLQGKVSKAKDYIDHINTT